MHKYRGAAKRAAWYDDDDTPEYNPFSRIRRNGGPFPTRAQSLEFEDGTILPDVVDDDDGRKPAEEPKHSDPLSRLEIGQTSLKSSNMEHIGHSFAEMGLCLAASSGLGGSSAKLPKKVAIMDLFPNWKYIGASGYDGPPPGTRALLGWRAESVMEIDFMGRLSVDDITSQIKDLPFEYSKAPLRMIFVQGDVGIFKGVARLLDTDRHPHKVRYSQWSSENMHPFSKNCSIIRGVALPTAWETIMWKPVSDPTADLEYAAFGLEYWTPQKLESLAQVPIQDNRNRHQVPAVREKQVLKLSVYIQISVDFVEDRRASRRQTWDDAMLIFDSAPRQLGGHGLLPDKKTLYGMLDGKHAPGLPGEGIPVLVCMVRTLFGAVAEKWDDYIFALHMLIVSVEEKIYNNPADEAQSTVLWSISKEVLQAQRLLQSHIQLQERIQHHFIFISMNVWSESDWLRQEIDEFRKLDHEIERTLKEPVAHLIDLMYKSVSIRDARLSLQLNSSLWRLSWITFIFLPLTFLVGFFGMNVDTFNGYPSLKWYFVAAVPLMTLVLLAWLATRQAMRRDAGPPLQRLKGLFMRARPLRRAAFWKEKG